MEIKTYNGYESYIFVSYCHKNALKVKKVLQKLSASNFRLWYDDGLHAGAEWPEKIGERLLHSEVFLAFISNASMKSRNCRNEINLAIEKNKKIILIYLEQTDLTPGMNMQLTSVQSIYANKMNGYAIAEKIEMEPLVNGCRMGITESNNNDTRAKGIKKKLWIIGILMACAMFSIWGYTFFRSNNDKRDYTNKKDEIEQIDQDSISEILYEDEYGNLTLNLSGQDLMDLSILNDDAYKNVTVLDISNNQELKSLVGIEQLNNLYYIDFSETLVADLTPLDDCVDLQRIVARNCPRLKNLESYAGINNLEALYIGGYNANEEIGKSFSAIGEMKQLRILNISEIMFDENEPQFSDYPNLEHLYANYTNISVSQVQMLPKLTTLWLFDSTGSLKGIGELTDLKSLFIGNDAFGTSNHRIILDALPNLKSIEELHLSLYGGTINDIEYLTDCKNMKILDLSGNLDFRYSDFLTLFKFSALEELDLDDYSDSNEAIDFSVFPVISNNMLSIEKMSIDFKRLADYTWIRGCKNLKELHMKNVHINADMSFLASLDKLEFLELNGEGIGQIDFLSDCKALSHVELKYLDIDSILDLRILPLHFLNLGGTYITDLKDELLEFENAGDDLIVEYYNGNLSEKSIQILMDKYPNGEFYEYLSE